MSKSTTKKEITDLINGITPLTLGNLSFIQENLLAEPISYSQPFPSQINFQRDIISAAPYGGSIAVLHYGNYDKISLYDPCLNFISRIHSPIPRKIIGLCLTPEELLIVVYDDTTLVVFSQRGDILCKTSVQTKGSIQAQFCAFYESGVFIVTYSGQVYLCDDFASPQLNLFASCDHTPEGGYAIGPTNENGAILWAYSSTVNSYLIQCIQKDNVQEQEISTRIKQITFSANRSLACAISDTTIIIFNNDFSNAFVELEIPDLTVERAQFVANDTVLVTCGNKLIMIGVTERTITWDLDLYGGGCFVSNEVDGARIFFRDQIMYIRPISGAPLQLLDTHASNSDIQRLFEALSDPKEFAKQDPIDGLIDILDSAISGCLDSAQFFRSPQITHEFLKDIAKTKHRLQSFNSEKFTQIVQYVRICDQLALKPFYMPLTHAQLSALHVDRLLIRLCNRYLHFYANRIADYVNEKVEPIFSHWTNCLIRSDLSPDEVLRRIQKTNAIVDFVDLATTAAALGKTAMSQKMLEANKVKARSVPIHIQQGNWEEAINDSVQSNDTTLLLYTLKKAQESNQQALINKCLSENPIALDAWLKLHPAEQHNEALLNGAGRTKEANLIALQKSINENGNGMQAVKTKANQTKDSLTVSIADRYLQIKKFKEANKVPQEVGEAPNDLYMWCLQQQNKPLAKKCAKVLGLQKDEMTSLKLQCYLKMNKPKELLYLLEEIGEDDDQMVQENLVKYLVKNKDWDTVSKLVSQMYDGEFKDEMKSFASAAKEKDYEKERQKQNSSN